MNIYITAFILIGIGLTGVVLRKNLISILMCLEVALAGVSVLLVQASGANQNAEPQVLVVIMMVVAAVEAAIGLALVLTIFNKYKESSF